MAFVDDVPTGSRLNLALLQGLVTRVEQLSSVCGVPPQDGLPSKVRDPLPTTATLESLDEAVQGQLFLT